MEAREAVNCRKLGGFRHLLGAFEVRGGQVVTGSYRASPRYRILSRDGCFRLSPDLRAVLLEELASLD